jgi:hypothetical protein
MAKKKSGGNLRPVKYLIKKWHYLTNLINRRKGETEAQSGKRNHVPLRVLEKSLAKLERRMKHRGIKFDHDGVPVGK